MWVSHIFLFFVYRKYREQILFVSIILNYSVNIFRCIAVSQVDMDYIFHYLVVEKITMKRSSTKTSAFAHGNVLL